MNNLAISNRIRKIREYRNYTQAYVAGKLKIKQNTYSQIETGQTSITHARLNEIAGVLDVSVDVLSGDDQSTFIYDVFAIGISPVRSDSAIIRLEHMLRSLKYEMNYLKAQNDNLLNAINSLKQGKT
jgi:transcriptional regulator with XRE-family HTH domain